MADTTVLFRARVPRKRLKRAEKVLSRLGLKPSDAFNMLLAQIELRESVPFSLNTRHESLLTVQEQGSEWTKALGEY
ncbi:MAG TPA: type II toxin-antitoxin system RelB/DinJ family antitoxin [Dongiaceae bacterium]|nr:type II toxin-antitoxin system RelB/DinJ family antitoxin [Dongiaceae bacterium]